MTIKELKKFLQLCRAEGVESIKFQDVEVHLGRLPVKVAKTTHRSLMDEAPEESIKIPTYNPVSLPVDENADQIDTDELTDEQRLFYSSDSAHGQQ